MKSNTLNILTELSTAEVVPTLQKLANCQLTKAQLGNVEFIVSKLVAGFTILDVVSACENVPGLREFALKLGLYCLPGEEYKTIFEREFGKLKQ